MLVKRPSFLLLGAKVLESISHLRVARVTVLPATRPKTCERFGHDIQSRPVHMPTLTSVSAVSTLTQHGMATRYAVLEKKEPERKSTPILLKPEGVWENVLLQEK